jgi:hypothetical protein
MIKHLVNYSTVPILLLALLGQQAGAAEADCKFYPLQRGAIDNHVAPQPAEEQDGGKLIARLAPADVSSSEPVSVTLGAVALAREGDDAWLIRRASSSGGVFAQVRGVAGVAEKWQLDYHRALTTVLQDSLRAGKRIDIVAKGSCK